jgi:acetyl esterase/lipase
VTVQRLDPTIVEAVSLLDIGDLAPEKVEGLRVEFSLPIPDSIEWSDISVPGDPELTVRVFRSKDGGRNAPCVYSIHGGGYVLGSRELDNALFATLCPSLGVVGVSVEYRLAPEHPYPIPLEDCYRGLAWCFENADELGIHRGRIGVAGVSAGGGLAAALALLARDRGEFPLLFQLLDCPMLDDRQLTASSQMEDLPVWSRRSNEFGWRAYLGDLYGRDDIPATAAPARAKDLSGLPPAFVSVGTVDGFRDEDILYALRLNEAGVPTELHVYPGLCHGYQLAQDAPIVRQTRADIERWLRRQITE